MLKRWKALSSGYVFGEPIALSDPVFHVKVKFCVAAKQVTSSLVPRNVIQSKPVNTDTKGAIESVLIQGVSVISWLNIGKM